jgi:hypothetical protein
MQRWGLAILLLLLGDSLFVFAVIQADDRISRCADESSPLYLNDKRARQAACRP